MNPYKMVIAVTNQKGGCAKTTTAVNIATALAKGDKKNNFPAAKVLLVDLDPQGNASTSFGVDKSKLHRTVYDLLMNDLGEELPIIEDYLIGPEIITDSMKEAWRQSNPDKGPPKTMGVRNLWLLPSNIQLSGAEIELATRIGRETRLKEGLGPAIDEFDYIIIDTPPSLGLLTINALAAANWVLIPVQTEYYALEGLSELMDTISAIRDRLNPSLKIEGILRTMYDPRSKLTSEVNGQLFNYFGDAVYRTVVPRNIRLAEAPSYGKPAIKYDKQSRGAIAYLALAGELLRRHDEAAAGVSG